MPSEAAYKKGLAEDLCGNHQDALANFGKAACLSGQALFFWLFWGFDTVGTLGVFTGVFGASRVMIWFGGSRVLGGGRGAGGGGGQIAHLPKC